MLPPTVRRHATAVSGPGLPWVASSAVKGLTSLSLELSAEKEPAERTFTVRLHFAEPEDVAPGERVFDVAVQGVKVLDGFDIVKEAGGRNRALVKEIKGVKASKELELTFVPRASAKVPESLISGLELAEEKR